jgi:hypothetical protein
MKKVKFMIPLILITFSFIGCTGGNENASTENITNNKELTQKERLDDFEYMYTIIKENHTYLEVNKRQSGIDWLVLFDLF